MLVALPTVAGAGLPLITEDTGTAERVEVEIAAAYQSAADGDSGDLAVAVNVGLLENLEASVAGTLALDDPADGGAQSGLGDTFLGVKYRFLDEAPPWPALLARVTLRLPTGDETRGLGDGDVSVGLLLAASRTLGPVTLTGNVGYTITTGEADADVVLLAGSVEWAVHGPGAWSARSSARSPSGGTPTTRRWSAWASRGTSSTPATRRVFSGRRRSPAPSGSGSRRRAPTWWPPSASPSSTRRAGTGAATYSMSFCFLISAVVSAAIPSTNCGMLAGL